MELHPATLWEALSDAHGDRAAIVQGPRRTTWRELEDRAARLATVLLDGGVTPGAKVGLLLHNSPEYIEAYFAALKIRAVPFNINWRYTAHEIAYLLENADADALVLHASLGDVAAEAVAAAGRPGLLLEVDDPHPPGPGVDRRRPATGIHAGTRGYEAAIAAAEPAARIERSPDDVAMTYTGGTTGMPKGVVAAVGPPLAGLLQTVPPLIRMAPVPIDEVPAAVAGVEEWVVSIPASPLMHGTGLGIGVLPALATGGTIVLLTDRHFDAAELWDTVVRERVNAITIVGDPFARPLLAELRAHPGRDLSSVRIISSAGAMFSAEVKAGILEHLPNALVMDIIAATEGSMGTSFTSATSPVGTGRFHPAPGVLVLADDDRVIEAGSGEIGLVAVPGGANGYYKDDAKTAATFRTIDGQRYAIPGDCATVDADGLITLLGRGSSCINTAGEKVYPEEVEEVLKTHPGVEDALVFGIDDERFGQRVAAVVSRANGSTDGVDAILAAAHEQLASFKVPRELVIVGAVPRTQVGKADYPTARRLYTAGSPES